MRINCLFVSFLLAIASHAQDTFQLASPFIKHPTIFFDDNISIPIVFAHPGATIRYTLNDQVPNRKSALYKKPVLISKNMTTLKARVWAEGFSPSDVSEVTFIKSGLPVSVSFPSPSPYYKGNGPATLFDNEGGIADPNSVTWLGYNADSVCFIIKLQQHTPVNKVLIHVLQNQGAWIFSPYKAAVYTFDNFNKKFELQPSGNLAIPSTTQAPAKCQVFEIDLKNIKTDQLKLILYNTQIPEWHPGSGQQAWLFIDEIKVY